MIPTLTSWTAGEGRLAAVLHRCVGDRAGAVAADLAATAPDVLHHGAAVAALVLAMAERAGLPERRLGVLARAALLHDAGKRYVAASILDKPGPLLPHERQVVEGHPAIGAAMLLEAGLVEEAAVVRLHHERWDGGGYPDRLFGAAIPYEARLIHVADAFDAMTTDRAYRAAMATDVALEEVSAAAGSQFDPACARLLAEVL